MLLPLLAALACAAPPDLPIEPPGWFTRDVERADKAMATVEPGRRLLGLTNALRVEPKFLPAEGPPIAFSSSVIGVDLARVREMTGVQFELALARARARAAFHPAAPLIDAEQAAEQEIVEYSFERAQVPGTFRETFTRALEKVRKGNEQPRLAQKDPEREAELLMRFAKDPDEFYFAVERELAEPGDRPRFIEVESFLHAYADRLDQAECAPSGRYCRVAGRLVPAALVAAARGAVAAGGTERVREELGDFQGEPARALRRRIQEWLAKR